jgi:hypothetical protein
MKERWNDPSFEQMDLLIERAEVQHAEMEGQAVLVSYASVNFSSAVNLSYRNYLHLDSCLRGISAYKGGQNGKRVEKFRGGFTQRREG